MSDNPQPNQPILPGAPNGFTDEQLDQEAEITAADIARAMGKAQAVPEFFKMINAKKTDKGRE